MDPIVYLGKALSPSLMEIAQNTSAKRVLIVSGKSSFRSSGADKVIADVFKGAEVFSFSDFSSNPKIEDVRRGIALWREAQPDLVVAIGGGSAIDMAKAINALAPEKAEPEIFVRGEKTITGSGAPLAAAPTTAGTGSEATHFAVVYIDKRKHSLAHPSMLPQFAIIDPALSSSMTPHVTASTGMDALAQAIESFWSIHATEESKGYARRALPPIIKNLESAVLNPTQEARAAMAEAAYFAGKAINISRTTACHALSYPLTAHFGVPHGHAVALTLPEMLRYNNGVTEADVRDPRGVAYVRSNLKELFGVLGVVSAEEAQALLEKLMDAVGLSRRLSALGIGQGAIGTVISEGLQSSRADNNPRNLSPESVRDIFSRIA